MTVTKIYIFAILFVLVISLLILMPEVGISSAAVINSNVYDYIRSGMYFLPIGTVRSILLIILGLWIFRVVIAFIKMIWGLLPVYK